MDIIKKAPQIHDLRSFSLFLFSLQTESALNPVFACHFIPTQDGCTEEVACVSGQEVACGIFALGFQDFLVLCFHEGQFSLSFLFEVLDVLFHDGAVGTPLGGCQLVGFAVVPQGRIVTIAMVSADVQQGREVLHASEYGDAWALSGVVEGEPYDTSHGTG